MDSMRSIENSMSFTSVACLVELLGRLHYNACQMDGRMLATGRLAPDVPQHVLASLGGANEGRAGVASWGGWKNYEDTGR